jgi:hypothetical protein
VICKIEVPFYLKAGHVIPIKFAGFSK